MPRSSSHAHRGSELQKAITQWFRRYEPLGIHWHKNHARTLRNGTIAEGEYFDFEVFYKGRLYAFDAKMCQTERWNVATNAKLKQVKALTDLANHGADAFFLVWFVNTRKLVKFSVPLPDGRASLTPEDGVIIPNLDILHAL